MKTSDFGLQLVSEVRFEIHGLNYTWSPFVWSLLVFLSTGKLKIIVNMTVFIQVYKRVSNRTKERRQLTPYRPSVFAAGKKRSCRRAGSRSSSSPPPRLWSGRRGRRHGNSVTHHQRRRPTMHALTAITSPPTLLGQSVQGDFKSLQCQIIIYGLSDFLCSMQIVDQ